MCFDRVHTLYFIVLYSMFRNTITGTLYITGLAHEYPIYSLGPLVFENVLTRLYPQYSTSPGYIYPL